MADFAPLINGVQYSGTSIRVSIFGVSLPGLKGIDFKKKADKANIYGAGSNVNARTYGRNTYEGKLTLLMSDVNALENASPLKDITKLPPFDIVIAFLEGVKVVSYTLVAVDLLEWSGGGKTDDKELIVEIPFIYAEQLRTR